MLNTINRILNKLLVFLGGLFLVCMIILTCANIISRLIWVPIIGTFELMGFFGAIVTAFALGYTQVKRGHIAVDVLVNTFPNHIKKIIQMISDLICCIFFLIAAWQLAIKATTLWETGEVTETLQVIYYPFTYAVAFGCLVLSLTLFTELIKSILNHQGGED